jgi:hypothetical protein
MKYPYFKAFRINIIVSLSFPKYGQINFMLFRYLTKNKNEMKISTKFILLSVISIVISAAVNAQTNVSGGIFSNTTWTLANSPYIVTGSVVVFPGYSLTIEPGVTVKFDSLQYLEIRQSTLIANGTAAAPILFTSNSSSPTPGIWGHANYGGVWLNGALTASLFNHCTITYSTTGLYGGNAVQHLKNSNFLYNSQYGSKYTGSISTDSCVFSYNQYGIGGTTGPSMNYCTISHNTYGIEDPANVTMTYCNVDSNQTGLGGAAGLGTANLRMNNCNIRYNQLGLSCNAPGWNIIKNCIFEKNSSTGIAFGVSSSDSLVDCQLIYNATGAYDHSTNGAYIIHNNFENNSTGIQVNTSNPHIHCNRICNNTFAGLQMIISTNVNVANNNWCTPDSASTMSSIYDGYDNASLGLAYFTPLDSLCSFATSVNDISQQDFPFSIYPNPATNHLTIEMPGNNLNVWIEIFNALGQMVYSSGLTKQKTEINIEAFANGMYSIEMTSEGHVVQQKFIKQ